jgi:hypothetical protein
MDLSSFNSEPKRVALFDDNEDFEFKPLSEGLGFHHEEKISIQPQVIVSKTAITKTVRVNPSQPVVSNNSNFIQSDLALFYENKKAPALETKDEPTVESEALKTIRFAAYFIDFTLVTLVTSFTIGLVSQLTGIDFLEQLMSLEEISLISVGFIFISYYFVYFTLLEKMQGKTFGMDLFGLKLKPKNELSLVGVFLYEMTILLGFLSFGLSNYFNLPQLIYGIKVIEKK